MNNKNENDLLRKNKKYIVSAALILLVGAAAAFFYYFYPGTIKNMFASGVSQEISATDPDVSATVDTNVPSSTDDIVDDAVPMSDDLNSNVPHTISNGAVNKDSASATSIQENISTPSSPLSTENNLSITSASDAVPITDVSSVDIAASSTCSFPNGSSMPPSRKIIFNEIAWMGSPSSSAAEWMEIKNISGNYVHLDGWNIMNVSGKINITFSSGNDIPSGGILLLSRNNSTTGTSYSGTLSNAGDELAIMDAQCNVSDILDASAGWPAGNNNTKQTLERDTDDIGWHTSVPPGGTPGLENSFVVPPIVDDDVTSSIQTMPGPAPSPTSAPATAGNVSVAPTVVAATGGDASSTSSSSDIIASTIALSHILIDIVQIAGVSSTNDLIKLYNPTESPVDMGGWKLHKRSSTGTDYSLKQFPAPSVIAPGQTFVWANAANGFSESVVANVSSSETLSADNSVALLDATGTVIDAVAWGSGTNQYGEGSPYATDPTGSQVLARKFVNGTIVDTENNTNDFILQ